MSMFVGNLMYVKILLGVATILGLTYCERDPMSMKSTSEPEICSAFFSKWYSTDKVSQEYSVKELLILQRCGLAYQPERQLSWYIAEQDVYPVPDLLEGLSIERDEYFRFKLVSNFAALAKSEKHSSRMCSDREQIREELEKSISSISDGKIRQLSRQEFFNIENYWEACLK